MKHYFYFFYERFMALEGSLYLTLITVLCLIGLCLSGCQPANEHEESDPANAALADAGQPPETVQIRYARGFDIHYHDHYKLLQLYRGSDTVSYLLLPRGTGRPKAYPNIQIIRVPIRKLVALSTTHIALADFVEADSIIVGLDNTSYVYDPEVKSRITSGEVTAVGVSGSLNQEMVVALQPDLLMVSGMPGTDLQKYQSIIQSGIPVLINIEWMEQTPLAKAEWVKLMAALTNREGLATAKFDALAEEYQRVASLTDTLDVRPKVISGSPFQGAWYVPGGKSYRAELYQEAGAEWPWATDSSAVSIPVAFENMYAYGLQAQYWLNPGMVSTLSELKAKDERFADFRSFQQGLVYNNNRRLTTDGLGNDFFESGVVNPHRILADLTHILHPELLPGHDLYYYQKLE